jgi:O6-methylguanine-DNA--protein-cysteine methyltransferase
MFAMLDLFGNCRTSRMIANARWLTFGFVVAFGSISIQADEPPEPKTPEPAEESVRDRYKRLASLAMQERKTTASVSARPLAAGLIDRAANAVNKYFSSLWRNRKVTHATVDDATFLRRVTLALHGVPAGRREAMAFLADDSQQKRTAKVEELLTKNRYADYWGLFLR